MWQVPLDKIRSVATDNSSRTSAALVQIFLKKFVGVDPGFTPQNPDLGEMLRWHDAAMLIGDAALQADTAGRYVYDLAEEWRRWTYLPFVFAFWTVRREALQNLSPGVNLAGVFQQSRNNGLKHVDEIARGWAPRLNLNSQTIRDYLTSNIDYSLDGENLQGLRLFYRYAAECNVLPAAPELRFVDQPSLAARP
jgi:chorismate dehydratase